mgnify:CR=1 FL=1
MEDTVLTPREVAERLRVHEATVRRWIREGLLPGAKFGRSYRIREKDLHEFWEKAMQEGVHEE